MAVSFVMAGGHSTRMNPLNLVTEKSLLPIIGKCSARVIVEKMLACRDDIQLEQIVICILKRHIDNWQWEFRDLLDKTSIIKFHAVDMPAGTAGHLLLASKDLVIDENEDLLIQYADSITDIAYQDFFEQWKNAQYPHGHKLVRAAIAVTMKARNPYSVIETVLANGKDKFLSSFEEKPFLSSPTWIGIAAINMGFLRNYVYNDLQTQNTHGLDFGHDIWGQMGRKYPIFVYENNDKEWYDIGTFHGYLAAREELKRRATPYNVVKN